MVTTTTKPGFRCSYRSDGTFLFECDGDVEVDPERGTIELDQDQTAVLLTYMAEIMASPGDDEDYDDDDEEGDDDGLSL